MKDRNQTEKILYFVVGFLIVITAIILLLFPSNKKNNVIDSKTTVVLERKNISLVLGDTAYLKYVVSPSNAVDKNVIFSSNNPDVVSVDSSGKITGLKVGDALITVTSSSGLTDECLVSVSEKKIDITSISLNYEDVNLNVGEKLTLKVSVEPYNASVQTYTWSSSNPEVATVKDGVVTAKKIGSTLITVTTPNKKIAICDVTVGTAIKSISFGVSSVKMTVNNEYVLKPVIKPSNATESVSWVVSDKSILEVKNGVVKAKKTGSATVTLESVGGVKSTVKFNVKAAKPGIKMALNASLNNIKFNESGKTLVFGSDYQGGSRKTNFTNLLNNLKKNGINPSLITLLGDYQSSGTSKDGSISGLLEANNLIRTVYPSAGIIYVQGNHDPKENTYLTKTGGYEGKNYVIYVINEDDFPSSTSQGTNLVKKTANDLDIYLASMIDLNIKKPVFVVTHLPLHYSTRSDNRLAYMIIDVLNKYGKKLDIFFMFGHNHSNTFDDCWGGSVNYVKKGSSLKYYYGGKSVSKTINFTYMNAGYIGWSKNTNGQVSCSDGKKTSTNNLTISTFKIEEDKIRIERYDKNSSFFTTTIKRVN